MSASGAPSPMARRRSADRMWIAQVRLRTGPIASSGKPSADA